MDENARRLVGSGTNAKGGGTGGVAASRGGKDQQRLVDLKRMKALARKSNSNEQRLVDIDTAVKVQANKAQARKPNKNRVAGAISSSLHRAREGQRTQT